MSHEPKESDWKRFRSMVPMLRERYLEKKNKQLIDILRDPSRSPTEQFWDTFERMKKEKKILEDCLDGHSRSNQFFSMVQMARYGMIKREDLELFSEGLRSSLDEYLRK